MLTHSTSTFNVITFMALITTAATGMFRFADKPIP